MDFDLTKEEKSTINTLKRLAKRWPESLWIFSAPGGLHVMRYKQSGERAVMQNGAMDPNYIVDTISGIEHDGGDW